MKSKYITIIEFQIELLFLSADAFCTLQSRECKIFSKPRDEKFFK
jgi:hypothetical protein